jgi:hypothetical protein
MQKKAIKVDFALIQDIEKMLDAANSKKRMLTSKAKEISKSLNDLQSSYANSFMMAKKASNSAKELGATDLFKLFESRALEAKDFENECGRVANEIFKSVQDL